MQSKTATVDMYLKEVPADRLPALIKIRQLFLRELKGYEETMRYGGPCYEKNNVAEAGFASQKNNIALYILKEDVMQKYRSQLKGISVGKGVIRYTKPDKIDFDLVSKMLADAYRSKGKIC